MSAPPIARPHRAMSLAEACAIVQAQLSSTADHEIIPLRCANGRVLAEGVFARADLPPRDCSAVDGFAIKSSDVVDGEASMLTLVG
jgi:molybdopterin molybdotransferase